MTDAPEKPAPRPWLALAPIVIFGLLALIFWIGLSRDPSELPSALIGKPAPEMSLPPIAGLDVPSFDGASLRQGGVTIVNVWASWCGPCRQSFPWMNEIQAKLGPRGLQVVGTSDDAEKSIYDIDLTGPVAWVLGAEGTGLRQLTRKTCDVLVRIPMSGAVESLNVSVASAVCLYETRRQRGLAAANPTKLKSTP